MELHFSVSVHLPYGMQYWGFRVLHQEKIYMFLLVLSRSVCQTCSQTLCLFPITLASCPSFSCSTFLCFSLILTFYNVSPVMPSPAQNSGLSLALTCLLVFLVSSNSYTYFFLVDYSSSSCYCSCSFFPFLITAFPSFFSPFS